MKAISALIAICLFSAPAVAITGNEALQWHRSAPKRVDVTVLAYVRGLLDGERGFEEVLRERADTSTEFKAVWAEMAPKMFCTPSRATAHQAYDILIAWLEANPEERHRDVAVHARVAFRRAWPCTP
ncbi:MAG: Rap1a/Tai family immunity protein [Rhizobacter sp.]